MLSSDKIAYNSKYTQLIHKHKSQFSLMGRRLIKFYICALWVSLKIQRLISNKTYTIFPHATARNEIRRSQSPIIQHPAPITHHPALQHRTVYGQSIYTAYRMDIQPSDKGYTGDSEKHSSLFGHRFLFPLKPASQQAFIE